MRGLPLGDIRVVELGQLLAGPFCGQLLGDFGAEVIKVEDPGKGDPMRQWGREKPHGKSLWWPVVARNKKSVTCDLRTEAGQDLVRRLVERADVLLENFRPGTLERWGMSPERLHEINPRLVITRVTGFGQTGPYAPRAGYGSIGEAMGGIRYVTGDPGLPPSRAGVSLGDSLAATYACIGTLVALHERENTRPGPGGRLGDLRVGAGHDGVAGAGVAAGRLPARTHRARAAERRAQQRLPHQGRRQHPHRRQPGQRVRPPGGRHGPAGAGRGRALRHPRRPRREHGRARRPDRQMDGAAARPGAARPAARGRRAGRADLPRGGHVRRPALRRPRGHRPGPAPRLRRAGHAERRAETVGLPRRGPDRRTGPGRAQPGDLPRTTRPHPRGDLDRLTADGII